MPDSTLAGILWVSETYLKLKQGEPRLHIDAVELHKQGKLKESLKGSHICLSLSC